jgi:hypothetical protein
MADEIRQFEVTIPAGTAVDSPGVYDISFPPRIVTQMNIRVPPGPSGLVGFRVTMAGNPVIPINPGEWIITDNDNIQWPMSGYPDSGAWEVTGYNTDLYDHTIYFTVLLDQVGSTAASAAPDLIDSSDLAAVPDAVPATSAGLGT